MKYLGWAIVISFMLAAFGLLDFHLCIKPAGQCFVQKGTP